MDNTAGAVAQGVFGVPAQRLSALR